MGVGWRGREVSDTLGAVSHSHSATHELMDVKAEVIAFQDERSQGIRVNEMPDLHDSGLIQVVAAVIERGDAYLICRRPLNKRHGGLWEFPGGKLLNGETPLEGARRELQEELAIVASSIGPSLMKIRDPGSVFEIQFHSVEAEGEPTPIEHSEIEWVRDDELLGYDLAPSDREFAKHLAGGR